MQVRLYIHRGFVVHHCGNIVDVNSTGSHIGGHQHVQAALGKLCERALTGGLRHVTVQGRGFDVQILQRVGHLVTQALRVAKHHRFASTSSECSNYAIFVHAVHSQKEMAHGANGGGWSINRHFTRVVHIATHQVADLAIESGGKQHRLMGASHMP